MDSIFTLVLILHIVGGTIGLLTGTINLIRKKGDKNHQKTGLLFTYSMFISGLAALILSLISKSDFLFMVGIFTLYLVSSGYRYLHLKPIANKPEPKLIDWGILIAMLLAGILFLGLGISYLIKSNNFGIVLITFGTIGLRFVWQDFQNYKGNSKIENFWLIAHIGRMSGAYVATLSAFLVVNWHHTNIELPPVIIWLFPTVVIVPFIIKWARKYEIKKSEKDLKH